MLATPAPAPARSTGSRERTVVCVRDGRTHALGTCPCWDGMDAAEAHSLKATMLAWSASFLRRHPQYATAR